MNLMEEKKSKPKNDDEAFIDDLVEMLDQKHKDLEWTIRKKLKKPYECLMI